MKKPHQDDQTEPCFITDGPPSSDLPMPPHRTTNLPQILADLSDDELARWQATSPTLSGRSDARLKVERHPMVASSTSLV